MTLTVQNEQQFPDMEKGHLRVGPCHVKTLCLSVGHTTEKDSCSVQFKHYSIFKHCKITFNLEMMRCIKLDHIKTTNRTRRQDR